MSTIPKESFIEIFNNYESKVASTPLQCMPCDNEKLIADVYKNLNIDLTQKNSFSYRYVITRLYWFLLIHYASKAKYPKLHSMFSKITNQTLLVSIRSLADSDEVMFYPEDDNSAPEVHEWYSLLKAKLAVTGSDFVLPETVSEISTILDIDHHLDILESSIDSKLAYDDNIHITLRGLYNAASSYIAIGVIVPLTRAYIDYIDTCVDRDIVQRLTCYIQYDRDILQNYVEKRKTVNTCSRKYNIQYPVSMLYSAITDPNKKDCTKIIFNTSVPYKRIENIEKDVSYGVKDISVTCFSAPSVSDLYDNNNGLEYDLVIETTRPEQVLNFFKIKDILPCEVYLIPLDPINENFYTMVDKIHSRAI